MGLIGAVVGGVLFQIFDLFPKLEEVEVSLRDIVAAFVGSLLILLVLWVWEKFRRAS